MSETVNPTIDDIKKEKQEAEKAISEILTAFRKSSGATIAKVDVTNISVPTRDGEFLSTKVAIVVNL